jgi:proline dehydrogenase
MIMSATNEFTDLNAPVSFEDTSIAFRYKSDQELFLSYLIFGLTKSPFLVKFLSQAAKFSLSIGLPVKPMIKATVFKQFCGGENREEYSKVITKLGKAGIGTILDYSVEGSKDEAGFENTKNELINIIEEAKSNENIPCTCMKMTGIGSFELLEKITSKSVLSEDEEQEWGRIKYRLEEICKASNEAGKPIYIDAEESWVQGAIDSLAEEMMAKYNKNKAIVFTTIQMFRWDRVDYLKQLIEQARSGSYKIGVKIVRGAYLEKERERARNLGYPSPINPTKAATDEEYNKALKLSFDNIDVVEICLGTHNEYSCKLLAHYMAEKKLPNNHPHIYFSQLCGMSDNISFNLANAGYNVSKYLPYGPVESTLPYLARRAEENTAIAGQMSKELEIIVKERKRRKSA